MFLGPANPPGSPTSGLFHSDSMGHHPMNNRQQRLSRNRNRLLWARRCRLKDHSRQGRLRRWGGRSRRTCSRIRRFRTGQGSHARNRGESGTASCSPRSVSRHAICHKWESPHGDRRPHRTRYPTRSHPVLDRCLSDRGLKKRNKIQCRILPNCFRFREVSL